MTHIAIQESLNGKNVDWMEKSATNNTGADATSQAVGLALTPKKGEIDMRPRIGLLRLSLFALTLTLAIPASAAADESPSRKDIQMVAPALDKYTQDRLLGDVWKRPGLSPRDRSIVTLAA